MGGFLLGENKTLANVLYPEFKQALLQGNVDFDTAAVKQMCSRLARGY